MDVLNRKLLRDGWPKGSRYVGRGTPLGNPYSLQDGYSRDEAVDLYRHHLEGEIERGNTEIIQAMRGLRADTPLVCSCAPKRCHAEVIRDVWQARFASERPLVFVFGSNLRGAHGKGAAEYAKNVFGAIPGVGEGLQGSSYGLPTKDERIQTRRLEDIALSVRRFLAVAGRHPELDFLVTRVGCGLAGYGDRHIGPLFARAPANCLLPDEWGQYRIPEGKKCLLVAGGRDFADAGLLDERLKRLTSRFSPGELVVLDGGADGADRLGGEWARSNGIEVKPFPAAWDDLDMPFAVRRKRRDGAEYNAIAGHVRNLHMLMAADFVTAFWDGVSTGTKHTVTEAERHRLPLRVVHYGPRASSAPRAAQPGM